jgi:mono/diheme cytochrome c family protein
MRKFLAGLIVGSALPFVVALAGGLLGFVPMDARSKPAAWETALANRSRQATLDRHVAKTANPVDPTEANLLAGMKLYQENCAGCHGDANGESAFGASFYPRVPQFVTHLPVTPDWEMFWIVKNGVRYTAMPSWDAVLGKDGDKKIWEMLAFIDNLEALPPSVKAEWHKKPA